MALALLCSRAWRRRLTPLSRVFPSEHRKHFNWTRNDYIEPHPVWVCVVILLKSLILIAFALHASIFWGRFASPVANLVQFGTEKPRSRRPHSNKVNKKQTIRCGTCAKSKQAVSDGETERKKERVTERREQLCGVYSIELQSKHARDW